MSLPFQTTKWSVIAAAKGDGDIARVALKELCSDYYPPVVAFLRAEGKTEGEALDIAHDFFLSILEGMGFPGANPQKGKFRSYLLGALKNFLANRRAAQKRIKRGGLVRFFSLFRSSEDRIKHDLQDRQCINHELLFEREWALNIVGRALAELRKEMVLDQQDRNFEILKPWLTGDCGHFSQQKAAFDLGISEGAIKVAIHRLRKRFRALVRSEVGRTVEAPEDVENEMLLLIKALGSADAAMAGKGPVLPV
jgi:RNA polymerase sigma-70 factor (ECF subfamily)